MATIWGNVFYRLFSLIAILPWIIARRDGFKLEHLHSPVDAFLFQIVPTEWFLPCGTVLCAWILFRTAGERTLSTGYMVLLNVLGFFLGGGLCGLQAFAELHGILVGLPPAGMAYNPKLSPVTIVSNGVILALLLSFVLIQEVSIYRKWRGSKTRDTK